MEPFSLFTAWLNEATQCAAIAEPTAMSLATADAQAVPSCRIVLLKAHDERGFVFFTNLQSDKSNQLTSNPRAALCFYWMPLNKQIRIEGKVEPVDMVEADRYFASRPRGSQIGAWASQQSRPLASRKVLERTLDELEKNYEGQPIPRPPHWSGWRVVPHRIEFWIQGNSRIHDRTLYQRQADGSWQSGLLYP